MKKRLFVAIELPEKLKDELAAYQQIIVKDMETVPRLTKKENLHITVSFLDTVEESYIPGLIEILGEVSKTARPFKLQYSGTIFGPPGRFPSMIWIVYKNCDEYTKLLREINGKVVAYLKQNRQPVLLSSHQDPTPHITLARFKERFKPAATTFTPISIKELSVSSFILMHSQLSHNGPSYTPLSSYPLT